MSQKKHEKRLWRKVNCEKAEENKRREQAQIRQQRFHERKKAKREGVFEENTTVGEQVPNSAAVVSFQPGLADGPATVSCAKTSAWCLHRSGQRGGKAIAATAKHTNYFHPLLWAPIESYMQCYDWSPQATVQALQRDLPTLFTQKFRCGHIGRWKQPGEHQWCDKVLLAVERGSQPRWDWMCRHPRCIPCTQKWVSTDFTWPERKFFARLSPHWTCSYDGNHTETTAWPSRKIQGVGMVCMELLPSSVELGAPERHSSSCPSSW